MKRSNKENILETEILNKTKQLIQNVEIKELKEVINDKVLDSFELSKTRGYFSTEYLESSLYKLFELMKLLDVIQDYQTINNYKNNSGLQ